MSWRRCRDEPRPVFSTWRAFHITLRVGPDIGRLRSRETYHAIRKAMHTTWARDDFRIVQISLEQDHIHVLVEAAHSKALDRGMRGFLISAARRLNVAVSRDEGRRARLVRCGARTRVIAARRPGQRATAFVGRYHIVPITSPWQARNVLRYVLNNFRKHDAFESIPGYGPWVVDYYSSGPSFTGWFEYSTSPQPFPIFANYLPLPVKPARTWYLAEGWRKYGSISLHDIPGTFQPDRS
jgi:putative transposase